MKLFFRFSIYSAAGMVLLVTAAHAQRVDGEGAAPDPFGQRPAPARAVPGGQYQSHALANGILTIRATDGSTLRVRPWATNVVKVEYFVTGRRPAPDSSVSVLPQSNIPAVASLALNGLTDDGRGQQPRTPVEAAGNTLTFRLPGSLAAVVEKNPLRISILRGTDTLVAEAAGAFRRVAQPPTAASVLPAPGGTAVRFRLAPGEHLYGTGSRALPVDRRGYRLELYNQAHYASQNNEPNLNITLPTVLSSRGYLLFFDHHTAGYLDLGKTDKNVLEYGGEGLSSLSYYVITGRDQAEILNRYTALTGRQPLPPRWALGLIQSRFGYRTAGEMQQVAARMRRENFPLDALVLDLYWFGGTTKQGDFSWYQPSFPDPAGMMSSLKKQGVHTILISEPYVMRTSRNDSTVRSQGLVGTTAAGRPFTVASFWAGPASILDVFKPQTRTWLWGHYRALHNQGAAGWWSDLGEPENHPEAMHHAMGPTRAVHNAYGQTWASILQENYTKEFPEERVFNLARSGWAGMQRNSVFPWSGDIQRSWSGYQAQIPVMLGMGQGGVGYMHSDAGGFCVGGIDSELYTRWLQMASLCPILRPHGEGVPPEPYYYPDPYKSSVREAVQLRYQLLPYLYTLAWQNSTTGAPLVRALDYEERYGHEPDREAPSQGAGELSGNRILASNASTATPDDQYLLGPSLLVAPVLNPSQRRRNVALPRGNWVDFHSNQTYRGGRTVGVVAPLAHAPLLVRAGAFLPMTAYRPSTALYRPDTLLLRYYPDPENPESAFTLYDDDGHSARALAQHQFALLTLRGRHTAAQTDIVFTSDGGRYPGQPAQRTIQLLVQRVAAAPAAVMLDGQPLAPHAVTYDLARRELRVQFVLPAPGATLSLRGLRLLTAPATTADPETLTFEAPDSRAFGAGGTRLHYTRHGVGAPERLLIRNAQGAVVRTFPLANRPGAHTLAWDGLDEQRHPLPRGVYVAEAGEQHQRLIVTE
ncbi:DUF5110 domain-containing protein [Hymenobacter sp. BT664]|uniref:DUF5110 domain-containing protein n=1 Tax=Hymenobacter montanus TaxID=2771359 RepID=A0A927GKF0_9BACT|nr:TIM-barrel domain-containing protein [Hymenobacter montanus]MBD2769497.1 DUF5110 domain-containing protein [Hymenobacter montanus]